MSIPLGSVNAAAQLSDEAFEALIDRNRRRFCVPAQEIRRATTLPAPAPEREDQQPEAPRTSKPPRASRDPYVAGQGGQDHKYLQHLLRATAHELGFKAEIELPVTGGSVDVAIEGRGGRIACEISIATDAEDEARNAAKCLAAGFDQVWLVVTSARRKGARQKAIEARLGADQAARLRVLTVPEALAELDQIAAKPESEAKQVRGYAVTVRRAHLSPDEARRKREAVASILAKSLRGSKD